MKRTICVVLCLAILAAGCGGRRAMPIQVYRPGDEKMRCEEIHAEQALIELDIAAKKTKRGNTMATNIVLGITGFFVIFPWFFMDFKDAEGTEIEALEQRQDRLGLLAVEQGC